MPRYVLDTDTFSLYRSGHPAVTRRVDTCPPTERVVTVITVEEQLSGWFALVRKARTPDQTAQAYQRLADAVMALSGWVVISFERPAMDRFGVLQALRLNVGSNDLRIAAIALTVGAVVVTRNRRDFERVPGLQVEDWSAAPLAGPPAGV